jgi:hypothetical protein
MFDFHHQSILPAALVERMAQFAPADFTQFNPDGRLGDASLLEKARPAAQEDVHE